MAKQSSKTLHTQTNVSPVDRQKRKSLVPSQTENSGKRKSSVHKINNFINMVLRVLKIIAYGLCGLLLISSLSMIITAGISIQMYHMLSIWVSQSYATPSFLILSQGIIVLFLAFLAISGVLKENTVILVSFVVLLTLSTAVEIAAGLLAGRASAQYDEYSLMKLRSEEKVYLNNLNIRMQWRHLQTSLECCGIEDPSSWSNIFKPPQVPISCCKGATKENLARTDVLTCQAASNMSNIYSKGCWNPLSWKIKQSENDIMVVSIGVAFLQFICIVYLICLAMLFMRKQEWQRLIVKVFQENSVSEQKENLQQNAAAKAKPQSGGNRPVKSGSSMRTLTGKIGPTK